MMYNDERHQGCQVPAGSVGLHFPSFGPTPPDGAAYTGSGWKASSNRKMHSQ
jgi:hypothetical protein